MLIVGETVIVGDMVAIRVFLMRIRRASLRRA
jgi:hypothetical protein